MRALLVVMLVGCAAEPVARVEESLATCPAEPAGALAGACDHASEPVPFPTSGTNHPAFHPDQDAYGVHLTNGSAKIEFSVNAAGTYEIYLGTPNIAFSVTDGPVVAPACASSIAASACPYLRKVYTYQLAAATSYTLNIGPSSTSDYVRVYMQSVEPAPETCSAGELTDEGPACTAADAGSTTIDATPLATSSIDPEVAVDTVYTVKLPSDGSGSYAGKLTFLPDADGTFELYLGTPNIPLRIYNQSRGIAIACTQTISSSTCDRLRRGDRLLLPRDYTWFELGPSAGTEYVRFELRTVTQTVGTVKLGPATHYAVDQAVYPTAADLDGDGVLDLAVTQSNDAGDVSQLAALRGSADGTFAVATTTQVPGEAPWTNVVVDADRDGIPDVVVGEWDGMGPLPLGYLHGSGDLAYGASYRTIPVELDQSMVTADLDEDGTPELVAAFDDDGNGDGSGGFVTIALPAFSVVDDIHALGGSATRVAAGDVDGDGHQDVIAAGRRTTAIALYRGDGHGGLALADTATLANGVVALATADLDGDGRADVIAVETDGSVAVVSGAATGFGATQVFQGDPVGFLTNIATGDFDHDGRLDIVIGNSGNGDDDGLDTSIFTATSSGYARAATLSTSGAVTVGDFNGDGWDDIALGDWSGVEVYLSTP